MLKLALDNNSPYHVLVPDIDHPVELINLGDVFLSYDRTLPPEEQSPLAPYLAALLAGCAPHQKNFYHSEAQRSIASEKVKALETELRQALKLIQQQLKTKFWTTPAQAENWGFEMNHATGNIMLPDTPQGRWRALSQYIDQEESRSPADRFPAPDLARLIELRRQIILNRKIRKANRAQRKMSRASRDALLQHLRDVLRVAGAIIIILQFDHTITLELQKWGFEVVKRPGKTKARAQEKAEGVGDAATVGQSKSIG